MMSKSSTEEKAIEFGWWVEIVTTIPACTYYFGPFASPTEALYAQYGYLEDLEQEGTQGISLQIKSCKPRELTIFKDEKAKNGYYDH